MKSQNQKILKHLQSGKSITPIEALNKFGCFRLGARIYDLKKDGWKIESEFQTKKGKSFSCYRLKNAIR
ncbi:MAG: helix-turn-helix domain-containing protein [Leptospiraceae bacterium]|nr:helix-turn-helix domain-containing protein [Leptospiraceae bacterium]